MNHQSNITEIFDKQDICTELGEGTSENLVPMVDFSDSDCGMSTVEYAIGTIAAAAFAGILYKVVTGGQIFSSLTELIMHALKSVG